VRARALSAGLSSPVPYHGIQPLLGTTDIELLATMQVPQRLARVAALRIERQRARAAERARLALDLLEAGKLASPGKRFSMRDAALARAGATNGSDMGPDSESPGNANLAQAGERGEVLDKRRLRGAERARVFAELRARREAREVARGVGDVRGAQKQGVVAGAGGVGVPGGGKVGPDLLCVATPPTKIPSSRVCLTGRPAPAHSALGDAGERQVTSRGGSPMDASDGLLAPGSQASKPKPYMQLNSATKLPPGVLDTAVTLTDTGGMAEARCPECEMRLQRGWCGRCRVRR